MRAALLVLTACSFRGEPIAGDAAERDARVTDTASIDTGAVIGDGAACATGWCYRKAVTIPAGSVTGPDINGFTMLVHVTDADLMLHARSDAADLYFADATGTKLAYERQKWVAATGELVAWVRLPMLPAAGTTLYLYYGNPNNAGDMQNIGLTWGSTFKGVWHLEETTGNFRDSSGNGNAGLAQNGLVRGAQGQIGNALAFDGTSAQLKVPQSASLQTLAATATFTMWINWSQVTSSQFQNVMSTSNRFTGTGDGFEWATQSSAAGGGYYFYPWGGTNCENLVNPSPFVANTWQYAAVAIDSTASPRTVTLFVDGMAVTPTTKNVGAWTQLATLTDFLFGYDANATDTLHAFAGEMDEIRVSTAVRPAAFLRTEWANQHDPSSFYSVGAQEAL